MAQILIVEDEHRIASFVAKGLRAEGHQPTIAVDGPSALAATVRPGVDGIVVTAGERRATFLPAVWPRVGGVDAFLRFLWAKAGLVPGTWPQGVQLHRYTTATATSPPPRTPLDPA